MRGESTAGGGGGTTSLQGEGGTSAAAGRSFSLRRRECGQHGGGSWSPFAVPEFEAVTLKTESCCAASRLRGPHSPAGGRRVCCCAGSSGLSPQSCLQLFSSPPGQVRKGLVVLPRGRSKLHVFFPGTKRTLSHGNSVQENLQPDYSLTRQLSTMICQQRLEFWKTQMWTHFTFPAAVSEDSSFSSPHHKASFPSCLITAILVGVKWHPAVGLTCTRLPASS